MIRRIEKTYCAAEFCLISAHRNTIQRQSARRINRAAIAGGHIADRLFAVSLHENRVSQIQSSAYQNVKNAARAGAGNERDIYAVQISVDIDSLGNDDFRAAERESLPD